MKSSTKFFLRASALAIVLSIGAFGYSTYRDNRLESVTKQCELQLDSRDVSLASTVSQEYQGAVDTCNVFDLMEAADKGFVVAPQSAQGQLLAEYRTRDRDISDYVYICAFFLLMIGAVPTAWYFLLARLSEVAAAVRRD